MLLCQVCSRDRCLIQDMDGHRPEHEQRVISLSLRILWQLAMLTRINVALRSELEEKLARLSYPSLVPAGLVKKECLKEGVAYY